MTTSENELNNDLDKLLIGLFNGKAIWIDVYLDLLLNLGLIHQLKF